MGRHPHSFAVPVPVIPPLANRKPRWEQAGLTRSTSSTATCVPHAQQACLVVADQSQAGLQCGGRPPPLARPTLPGVSAGTRDTRQSAKFIQLIKSGQCSPPWSFSFLHKQGGGQGCHFSLTPPTGPGGGRVVHSRLSPQDVTSAVGGCRFGSRRVHLPFVQKGGLYSCFLVGGSIVGFAAPGGLAEQGHRCLLSPPRGEGQSSFSSR